MKDEALKLALEALERATRYGAGGFEYAKDSIKQALAAQPAPVQEPVAEVTEADTENYKIRIIKPQPAGTKLYTTPPAQPAPLQEPVALEAVYETIIQWDEGGGKRSRRELARRIVDLYTTPPAAQRTWIGLTDEEIEQGCKESWVTEQAFQSAVWWAEAKLKEKNNG